MFKKIILSSIILFATISVFAQQPLPDFNIIKGPKDHTIISWRNNFGEMVTVLNIQRSTDSVRGFMTIYSAPSPSLNVNAYTDNKPIPGADYYRIYYMLKNGSYQFTEAKKVATGFVQEGLLGKLDASKNIHIQGATERQVPFTGLKKIIDSVTNNTSDSLYYMNDTTVEYAKYNALAAIANTNQALIPVSRYLYMNADGYIVIRLPENQLDKYSMTIYQQDGRTVLFKINKFYSSEIILSKSSFFHSGWYPYEIFEDGKLKERSRLEIK